MKNTVIPAVCSLALVGMSAAVCSHWWSVLECTQALSATTGGGTITLSLPPLAPPAPPAALATATPAPAADPAPSAAPAAKPDLAQMAEPTVAQREFYEAMLDEMRQIKKENLALRDQVAETNRDIMKLEFRVDTHSESFRPLPAAAPEPEPEVLLPAPDDGGGLLPPISSLSR